MQTDEAKAIVKQRGSIAEHPFGTIKQTLGWSHFLVRGKEKVSGENALIMFTYNFKRMLNLIGIDLLRKLIIAMKEGNIEAIREEIVAYITNLWCIWKYRGREVADIAKEETGYMNWIKKNMDLDEDMAFTLDYYLT